MTDTTLHVAEGKGLWLPPEFADHTDGLVIRTPTMTVDHKPGTPIGPYGSVIEGRHFDVDGAESLQNPELAPDKVSLKKYGEEPRVFEVDMGVRSP